MTERRLVVPGRFDRLQELTACVTQAAQDAGLDESSVFHCQMAVDEACTNIIEHAYGGEDRGEIAVTCEPGDGWLRIEIRDRGKEFAPPPVEAPAIPGNLEDLSVGGLGLYFMHALMDEVEFTRDGEGNRLVMVKRGRK